jgi:hypothetical protein
VTYCRLALTAALVILATGASLMLAGIDGHSTLYRAGLTVWLIGGLILVLLRMRLSDAVFERIRQEGYDAGYEDGCTVRRAVSIASVRETLPLGRPSEEFAQQGNVGS